MSLFPAFQNWLFRLRGPEPGPVFLYQRRVFILPTREGLIFAGTLIAMLVASINYIVSLGYVLTFLLISMGMVTMVHTFRNLAHLTISAGKVDPVFSGELAQFQIYLENTDWFFRYGITLHSDIYSDNDSSNISFTVPASQKTQITLPIKTSKRGWCPLGRLTLSTCFPFGWFRAWSYVELDMRCLVYPAPEKHSSSLPISYSGIGQGMLTGIGSDDFLGLRAYQPTDSPRHVAWKALVNDTDLMTKQFSNRSDEKIIFDWNALPAEMNTEARLSRLTSWVLQAEQQSLSYGLRLPNSEIQPNHGQFHQHTCLKTLALYGI